MRIEETHMGYCREQIEELLDHTWQEGDGVAYVKEGLSDEVFLQMPLIRQYMRLMEMCKDGIKLTPSGYLPNKVVAEVYPLGPKDWYIEEGHATLGKHCHCHMLCQTWELLLKTGYVKKRKGVLSLTAKGKKLIGKPEEIFRDLIISMATDADTFFLDAYDMGPINDKVQMLCAMLAKDGKEFKPVEDYAWAYAKCHGRLKHYIREDRSSYEITMAVGAFGCRLINRFLEWFNLVEFKGRKYGPGNTLLNPDMVRTTDLFHQVIGINPPMTAEKYMENIRKNTVIFNPEQAMDFFDMIGLDTEDFPIEEIDESEDSPEEMIAKVFFTSNKYKS